MPGMMDTILNIGLNDKTVVALKKKPPMEDLRKIVIERFIQMYSKCSYWNRVIFI